MKKLFLSVAIVATMMLTACSSSEKAATDKGAELKAKIENCSNPDSLKVYIQQAQEYVAQLAKEGNDSAANAYLQEITPAIVAKDPTAVSLLTKIKNDAKAVATEATDSAKAVADSATADVVKAIEGAKVAGVDAAANAKAAVENAKESAKATANEAKAAANETANKAVDNAKNAASNAIQSAADKAKSKIK
jgi:hypothetical protein